MKPSYLFVSVDYLYGSLRTEAASSKRRCTSVMAYDTDDCKDTGAETPTEVGRTQDPKLSARAQQLLMDECMAKVMEHYDTAY